MHLSDLAIEGFRGIERLSIPRLGHVTLLAGRNGVGKTTVLDAVRLYAARGRPAILTELLNGREEFNTASDEAGGEILFPDLTAFFHGREMSVDAAISIGPDAKDRLGIDISTTDELPGSQQKMFSDLSPNGKMKALQIMFRGKKWLLPVDIFPDEIQLSRGRGIRRWQRLFDEDQWEPAIECASLGPGLLGNSDMARFWDKIALTDSENLPLQALQLILGDVLERVTVIGDGRMRSRRVIVRLRGSTEPVPLKSLGDGAVRLFSAALALANSRNGFLLIDEAENGIHYSVQRNFWRMVLRSAHKDNVQVLATTHSWDCVRGFAQAAAAEDAEGVLVRLDRDGEEMRAVEYSEAELKTAAEQGIEVR